MKLGGLSSVCAKLEQASIKKNGRDKCLAKICFPCGFIKKIWFKVGLRKTHSMKGVEINCSSVVFETMYHRESLPGQVWHGIPGINPQIFPSSTWKRSYFFAFFHSLNFGLQNLQ